MKTEQRLFEELGELKGITSATLEQAKKTNGRVTELERRANSVDVIFAGQNGYDKGISKSKALAIGALTFCLGSVIVPIISAYLSK